MQVGSIKAEFSPSIGICITAECLIGKMNLGGRRGWMWLRDWKHITRD